MRRLLSEFNVLLPKRANKENVESTEMNRSRLYNLIFNQDIKAYVEVCCSSESLEILAFDLVEFLTKKQDNKINLNANKFKINDIEIYNKLMFTLAKRGKTANINGLLDKLRNENLHPNLNTFAAALQSLGHNLNNSSDDLNLIRAQVEQTLDNISKANVFKIRLLFEHFQI